MTARHWPSRAAPEEGPAKQAPNARRAVPDCTRAAAPAWGGPSQPPPPISQLVTRGLRCGPDELQRALEMVIRVPLRDEDLFPGNQSRLAVDEAQTRLSDGCDALEDRFRVGQPAPLQKISAPFGRGPRTLHDIALSVYAEPRFFDGVRAFACASSTAVG